jgi:hypothetical protein
VGMTSPAHKKSIIRVGMSPQPLEKNYKSGDESPAIRKAL